MYVIDYSQFKIEMVYKTPFHKYSHNLYINNT